MSSERKSPETSSTEAGTVVAAFGRHYEIAMDGGGLRTGYPRGKKSSYACGDEVSLTADGQLLSHAPRRSLLYRSDAFREKLLAANATQLVLVVATEPSFSDALLSRALVAAEQQSIKSIIVLNKIDLAAQLGSAREMLAPLARLGYPVIELSARQGIAELKPFLMGQVSILLGQSGMGKSTLINALVPDATAATREISSALDSGKHTTTCTRLYALPNLQGAIIDSPGLQEFGLAHLTRQELDGGFVEFRPLLGQCRYRDCRHRQEPGCVIKTAIESGQIHPRRLEHYLGLMDQLESRPHY